MARAFCFIIYFFCIIYQTSGQVKWPMDGKLYYTRCDSSGICLGVIDLYNQGNTLGTCVCPMADNFNGIACNPIDGLVYFTFTGGLYSIDANCDTQLVCPNIGGLYGTFDNNGLFWKIRGSNLEGYNITTCSLVKTLPINTTGIQGDAADVLFNPFDNKFYDPATSVTISVDTNGVQVNLAVGTNTGIRMGGVAMGCDSVIYGIENGNLLLHYIDLKTGTSGIVDSASTLGCGGNLDMGSFAGPCNVASLPIATVTGASVCSGNCFTLSATVQFGSPSFKFSWSPNVSDTTAQVSVCPGATTVYTVTVTDSLGNTSTDTAVVMVNTFQIDAGPDTSVCVGDSTMLNPSAAAFYNWSPSAGLSCTSCTTPVASPNNTTTYYLLATDANNCSASDSITVTVHSLPIIDAGQAVSICSGTGINLNASGGNKYSWTPITGLSCDTCPNPFASPGMTTIYSVTGTDGNGCAAMDTVTVEVSNIVTINAGSDRGICPGDSTAILVNPSTGYNYTWLPATSLSCTNCPDPIANPSSTTVYTVMASTGNCSGSDTIIVSVHSSPNVSAGPDVGICGGNTISLHATGAINYSWQPATGLSCDTCSSPVASPSSTTQYTVVGTDGNGCTATDTVIVTIGAGPVAYAFSDTTIEFGESLQLLATGGLKYQWNPKDGLSCDTCIDPIATPFTSTTYCVYVSDNTTCVDTACVNISVDINCGEVFVPSAFSPNADHQNDLECVLGNCITSMVFQIFDRWGEKVFETTDPSICWNGMYGGKPMNAAVFAYTLTAKLLTGETVEKKGNISLIR